MADQENNGIGVADTFPLVLEDCSFEELDRNPVVSNSVKKVEERAKCENLGIPSGTVVQEMRNGAEPTAIESTLVLKVDGEACESLGISGCNIEDGMGSISLAGGLQSSEQDMRNGAETIAVEATTVVEADDEVRQEMGVLGGNSIVKEGVGSTSLVSGLGSSVIIGKNDGKTETKMDEDESESSESESDDPSSSTSASSSSSSDSDDSSTSGGSSDDDDSEDSEEEEHQEEEKITKKIEVEVEEGEINDSDGQELGTDTAVNDDENAGEVSWSGINDEDDEDGPATEGPIRSKNEVKDLPSVPPVNVTIEPHHQMLPVGVVMSIISPQVIVEGIEKHDPLNEGSILWITETRTPLGLVDEIFGPVKNPYYIVRYNSENEIPKGVHVGTLISFVPEFANHVLNNKDVYKKGYDASGLNDEEVSDEAEFSDDEKEAEYRKMQKVMKRGISDKNHGKHKNNKKKASRKNGPAAPPNPVPSASTHNHQKFPPFSGIRPGPFEAASIVPPFRPANPGPNLASNGVWTNGISLMQPQTALLPNGFPPNDLSLFPGNAQNPYQLPVTGIPFQQQLGPNLGSLPLPGTSLPLVQPNIFAQPMHPQGLLGQNQMTFGMSFPQVQTCVRGGGEQGFLQYGMQPEKNHNFQSGSDNVHAPNQFRSGGSANRGRKTFHQRGRKGWRPTK
ncbi:H/ACA ribonucleoprotein complex non-core subunit NAF1-like isoform X2 [Neltuma alba]|uniref:H/ACA ribonucleoprotein complex non-core subunit NAF1-like isoform X2 n=2 Tax=Neltuma alba TaxID=207710 RepID=UPI0010A46CED|nr:H/ACA ribonucleoprotein complex non-core subunit NAF1-like isoform X2 [Prosopis alba]